MSIDDIKNIAVIGAGNMGHQIAMLCAIHGYKTVCTDINTEILKKAGLLPRPVLQKEGG